MVEVAPKEWVNYIKNRLVEPETDFESLGLELFDLQRNHSAIYNEWLTCTNRLSISPRSLSEIPCLPISFFKTHIVTLQGIEPRVFFESSRTTGQVPSRHAVADVAFYQRITRHIFEDRFGPLTDFSFLALLPNYLANPQSSLLAMVNYFMEQSRAHTGGYLLDDPASFQQRLEAVRWEGRKPVLFGVTFALLTLCDKVDTSEEVFYIFETGGMKGRGPEVTRAQLHERLLERFPNALVFSEYGMTELLSQGYTTQPAGELFAGPAWLQAYARDIRDPFMVLPTGQRGGLNIIDLANVESCAFIETSDMVEVMPNGTFRILGRLDNSEIRGCNLLVG